MTNESKNQLEFTKWLIQLVAANRNVDVSDIDPDMQFVELGLDSMSAVTLVSDIELEIGIDLDASVVRDHPTIADLSRHLVGQGAVAPQLTTDLAEE